MEKKPFNTQVDESLANAVREKCKQENIKVTDLVEALFNFYLEGDFKIERKTVYTIKRKGARKIDRE